MHAISHSFMDIAPSAHTHRRSTPAHETHAEIVSMSMPTVYAHALCPCVILFVALAETETRRDAILHTHRLLTILSSTSNCSYSCTSTCYSCNEIVCGLNEAVQNTAVPSIEVVWKLSAVDAMRAIIQPGKSPCTHALCSVQRAS